MAQDRGNLFKRLTSLFKSGPVVKKKITSLRSSSTTKSSAIDVFRKSTSSVYGNALHSYGNYDRLSRLSEYCLVGETKIADNTQQGYTEIKDIVEKFKNNEDCYVFSYDHKEKDIKLAKIKNASFTGVKQIWEIEFDNGSKIRCTDNHPIMLRDGSYKRTDELSIGMAVMPFYRRNFYNVGYRNIYTFKTWRAEHVLVGEYKINYLDALGKNSIYHVHHKNFKKFDNRIENLDVMLAEDHLALHARINNKRFEDPKQREKTSNYMKNRWSENGHMRNIVDQITEKRKKHKSWKKSLDRLVDFNKNYKPGKHNSGREDQKGLSNANSDKSLTVQDIYNSYIPGVTVKDLQKKLNCSRQKILSRLKWDGYKNYKDFQDRYLNHKIVKITKTNDFEKVYDIEVEKYHNFAICEKELKGICFVHNSEMDSYSPEIHQSLNIYSEESLAKDAKGKSLHIFSENKKIQKILEDLFFNVINFEFVGRSWVRNLCKYGDFFLLTDVSPEFGVINCHPIPVNEIVREEGYDPENPFAVRFRWESNGNQVLENWQIVHFRLNGNDAYMPYGSSIIDSARRVFRQLCLHKESKIWTKDGYKTIDKIIPGDIVYSYDYKTNKTLETKVKHCLNMGIQKTYKVKTYHRNIIGTDKHGLLVKEKSGDVRYKKIKEIIIGEDCLYSPIVENKLFNKEFEEQIELNENVLSIEEYDESETYDLEIDHELHNFISDGIVSHNTLAEDSMLAYRVIRCLHGDSILWTDTGYKKIKDINVGDKVFSYDYEKNNIVSSDVTDFVCNGKQKIWNIVTKHRTLKTNSNHPILVKNNKTNKVSYVNTENLIPKVHQIIKPELKNNEQIKIELNKEKYEWFGFLNEEGINLFKNKIYEKSKSSIMREIALKNSIEYNRISQFFYHKKNTIKGLSYKISEEICLAFDIPLKYLVKYPKGMFNLERINNIPEFVDEEFARFFGFMLGDGFVSKKSRRIGFSTGIYPEMNLYYSEILKKYCSNISFSRDKRSSCEEVGFYYTQSFYFANLMKDMGYICGVHNKELPKWIYRCSDSIKEAFIDGLVDADGHGRKMHNLYSYEIELCNEKLIDGLKELCHQLGWNVSAKKYVRTRKSRTINNIKMICNSTTSYSIYFTKTKSDLYENILSVKETDEIDNVYDIRVDNNLHNFIANGMVVHNSPERRVFYIDVGNAPPDDVGNIIESARSQLKTQSVVDKSDGRGDARYNSLAVDMDYFIPVRGSESNTKIDTLPGGQNTTAIEDVQYLQSKLFAALGVPKPYLTFDENLGSKASLAQLDLRFSRAINQIQQVVISELNKIAAIHLYANGYDGDDLVNFSLYLSNPSTIAVQQKLELLRTRFEIASSKPEGLLDSKFIYKEVMDLTDDEIKEIKRGQIEDAKSQQSLDQLGADGGSAGSGVVGGGIDVGGAEFGGSGDFDLGDFGDTESSEDLGGEDLGGEDLEGDEVEDEESDNLFAGNQKKNGPIIKDSEDEIIELEQMPESEHPINQRSQISRTKHNRQRLRKAKGASVNMMPKLSDMLSPSNRDFSDAYDFRSNNALSEPFKEQRKAKARIDLSLKDSLKTIKRNISINNDNLLSEDLESKIEKDNNKKDE